MPVPLILRRWWIILNISIGVYMSTLDASIVNISLPTITRALKTHLSTVAWVVMAYLIIITGCLLVMGRLADLFGERRIYLLLLTFWAVHFITFVILLYGNQLWLNQPLVALPRLHYTNFLWVYLAAGFCLNCILETLRRRNLNFLAYALPILVLILILLLNNADILGWHQLYALMD